MKVAGCEVTGFKNSKGYKKRPLDISRGLTINYNTKMMKHFQC